MKTKPIRALEYNIEARVYKNDKYFESKLFKDFNEYEFWITRITNRLKEKIETIIFINKIEVYQLFENNKKLKLTTWIFDNGQLKQIYD